MKKTLLFAVLLGLGAVTYSCNLDLFPETGYTEMNVPSQEDTETGVTTREDIRGQLDAMYDYMRGGMQTYWYQFITLADARADNAYGGNLGEPKVVAVEANRINSENEFPLNLWNYSMNAVDKANQVICNIDYVKENDPALTDTEYRQWLSEALCFRAYIWINMMYLFGEIPMLTVIPPAITSANIEEVYPLYFPPRVPQSQVGERIVADIEEYACLNAPDVNSADKFKISKGFAHGILARFYAMREFRDWDKVIDNCEAVEALGYALCDNYGDLWHYTPGDTGFANQNQKESIFEISWPAKTSGSWMWMMFYRNAYNPNDSFSWAKWCTPSRNIAAAYDAQDDEQRKAASIAWDECSWSFHYDKDNYAFMHKLPTNVTPIYIMRLADIYLLHAEALANTDQPGLAADYVDLVRGRADIALLTSAQRA